MNVQMIFEPGRMISGNAGVLLSKVLYRQSKPVASKPTIISLTDSGLVPLLSEGFSRAKVKTSWICHRRGLRRREQGNSWLGDSHMWK